MSNSAMNLTPCRVHAVWTVQEEGHHTAKVGESTLGHVVMVPDGSFIAFDGHSTPLGRYPTLRAAQLSALRAAERTDAPTLLERLTPPLALAVGAIAVMLLTIGAVVLSLIF